MGKSFDVGLKTFYAVMVFLRLHVSFFYEHQTK
jgi:hypothetical protein